MEKTVVGILRWMGIALITTGRLCGAWLGVAQWMILSVVDRNQIVTFFKYKADCGK